MLAFGDYALLRPLWLLALAPLLLAALLRPRRRGDGLGDWARAADPHLVAAMARARRVTDGAGRGGARGLILAALALIAAGLSGPALRRPDAERFRNLDANFVLVDLSGEAASGAQLRQARSAAHLALEAGAAREAGLILYAGDAYFAAPPTDDAGALASLVFAFDGETVPDPGARPDLALALARRAARETGLVAGDATLISSGAGVGEEALAEARALHEAGVSLHALFMPAPGRPETETAARRAALMALAAAGGGAFADASAPGPVLAAVEGRSPRRLAAARAASLYWRDCGRALLALAALPALLALRRFGP